MKSFKRSWLENSAANLFGGASAALFNLLLPSVVSRHLPEAEFAGWSLALQIVAYINLLSLGLQMATARAIAQAHGKDDTAAMQRIVKAGNSIATAAVAVASTAALLIALCYPLLFPGIPAHLLPTFRLAVLMIGLSTAWQLFAVVPMGVFQGLHRNITYVSVQISVRLLVVCLIYWGANAGLELAGLAALLAIGSVMLWPLMREIMRRSLNWSSAVRNTTLDRGERSELLGYCISLSGWNVATLMVNSVGMLVVGRIMFEKAGVYSLAMTAALVLASLLGALFSPLVTMTATLHAKPERRNEIPALLMKTTLGCTILLNLLFAACLWIGREAVTLWVGPRFVEPLVPLLILLVGAHALRNLGSPYALMSLATGLHRPALLTAAVEALCNLVATVVLGLSFGIKGVAAGTLVGSLAGIMGILAISSRQTPELTPQPLRYALIGIIVPTVLFLPIHLLIARWKNFL